MNHSADILLVTVNRIETKAVLEAFATATGQKAAIFDLGNQSYHELGRLNGLRVVQAQSEMGSVGLGASLITVSEAVGALRPKAVIMVGVAFGMNQDKQSIGQVLVADRIMSYEPEKAGAAAIPRGPRVDVSIKLLKHFKATEVDWERPDVPVAFGLMVSGEKLVDNLEFRRKLRELEPEAIGGEMEGAGLYAACQNSKVDWILVKAICDWADGHKDVNKEAFQKQAARNATALVVQALQSGKLVESQEAISTLPSSRSLAHTITITLNGRLADFTEKKKQALKTLVASLAGIKEYELRIISVVEGSIRVTLELPPRAIGHFCEQWEALWGAEGDEWAGRGEGGGLQTSSTRLKGGGGLAGGFTGLEKQQFARELRRLNVQSFETSKAHGSRVFAIQPQSWITLLNPNIRVAKYLDELKPAFPTGMITVKQPLSVKGKWGLNPQEFITTMPAAKVIGKANKIQYGPNQVARPGHNIKFSIKGSSKLKGGMPGF